MAQCKDCIHKNVCLHRANIQNDTYAYMSVKYDTEKCKHYNTSDVVPKNESEWIDIYSYSGVFGDYEPFIEFKCADCLQCYKIISSTHGWQYGDPVPWVSCPVCGAKMKGGADQ